jgi:Cof subfamily protein (haloacid dehalogenase superfamily)
VILTIATGRLIDGTLPLAVELGLDCPVVCADGAVVARPGTGEVIRSNALDPALVESLVGRFEQTHIAPFVFTASTNHAGPRGTEHHSYVRGWSPTLVHTEGWEQAAYRADVGGVVMLVGIGTPEAIGSIEESVIKRPELSVLSFGLSFNRARVLRIVPNGVSKGAALATLAAELGVERANVAVIGDWHNDLPMFEWAASSFAMPHAPPELKKIATVVLDAEAPSRGAIADALARWLMP